MGRNFTLSKVKVVGISACVPTGKLINRDSKIFPIEDMEAFINTTGVEERRKGDNNTCTSDLSLVAGEQLIKKLNWDKNDIEILVFVSQSADYKLPVTSAILQDRMGLSKNCIAFDVPLGCSGYVYGLSVITSFMQSAGLKKGILLAGDTTQPHSQYDKSVGPLFGDAASATALEYDENAPDMLFNLGTDGSGHGAIIIPDGGARNPFNETSLVDEEVSPGIVRNKCNLIIEGMDVFSFGITQAPKTVNELLAHYAIDKDSVDHFIFHQANMMMNNMIVKKLKLPAEKVSNSLKHFGNTSSASIPLTLITERKEKLDKGGKQSFVLCGFGVGLSWGTVHLTTDNLVCLNLIEYEESR